MPDRKYFIAVASLRHVEAAVKAGVLATGPDGESEASRVSKGDWFACYSPGETMEREEEVRQIVAVGQIEDEGPEERDMPDGGRSWARRASYHGKGARADIYDLLDDFSFVSDRSNWGVHFHRSLLEVTKDDMLAIFRAMDVDGRKL